MLDWLVDGVLDELLLPTGLELLEELAGVSLVSVGVGLATQALSAIASTPNAPLRWIALRPLKLKSLREVSLGTGFPLFIIVYVKMVDSSCFVAKRKSRNYALGHEGSVHR